jgi:hypothetical protein
MWEGPQRPDCLVFFIKHPRPRLRNQICSPGTACFPLLGVADQSLCHRILFYVVSDKPKLLRCLHKSIVIAILPRRVAGMQKCGRLGSHEAHHVVHQLRQGPWFVKSEQRMPMIRHNDKCSEVDSLVFHGKVESRNDNRARIFIQNRFLRMKRFGNKECCWRVSYSM